MRIEPAFHSKMEAYDHLLPWSSEVGVKKGQILTKPGEKRLLASLGQKVREIREKKKLSVYDVTGDDMPIKFRQHWQDIEAGKKNINITTVFRVAECLDVKPEELIRGLEK